MPSVAHGRGPLGNVAAAAAAAAASAKEHGGPQKYLNAKARGAPMSNGQSLAAPDGRKIVEVNSAMVPPRMRMEQATSHSKIQAQMVPDDSVSHGSSKEDIIEHLMTNVPLNDLLTVLLAMRRASQPPVRNGSTGAAAPTAPSSWQGNAANALPQPQSSGMSPGMTQPGTLSANAPSWSPMPDVDEGFREAGGGFPGPEAASGYPTSLSGYNPNPYAQPWVPGQAWTPNEYAQPFTMPAYMGATEPAHDQGANVSSQGGTNVSSKSGPSISSSSVNSKPRAGAEFSDGEDDDGEEFDPAMMLSDVAAYLTEGGDDEMQ